MCHLWIWRTTIWGSYFIFFSKFTYLFFSGFNCTLVQMFAMLPKRLWEKECYKLEWLLILLNLSLFYCHLLRRSVLPYDGLVWQLTWHPRTRNKKLKFDTQFCFASFLKEKEVSIKLTHTKKTVKKRILWLYNC